MPVVRAQYRPRDCARSCVSPNVSVPNCHLLTKSPVTRAGKQGGVRHLPYHHRPPAGHYGVQQAPRPHVRHHHLQALLAPA